MSRWNFKGQFTGTVTSVKYLLLLKLKLIGGALSSQ